MTKKSLQILAVENRKFFREKVKLEKCFVESEKLSKIGGDLKQREMNHCLRGWTPLVEMIASMLYIGLSEILKRFWTTVLVQLLMEKRNDLKFLDSLLNSSSSLNFFLSFS